MKLTRRHEQLLNLIGVNGQGGPGLPRAYFDAFPAMKKEARDLLWDDHVHWVNDRDGKPRLYARPPRIKADTSSAPVKASSPSARARRTAARSTPPQTGRRRIAVAARKRSGLRTKS